MFVSNFKNWCEDGIDEPLFIRFSKIYQDKTLYGLNKKIREFEAAHPYLALASFDEFTKIIPVYGDYLFSDKLHKYYELKYTYSKYREIRYYEPDPTLAEWLTRIDEFTTSKSKFINESIINEGELPGKAML